MNSYQNLFSRPNTIIVGDFNAKNKLWNSTKENARRRAIEQLLIQNNYVALNTSQPTYQNSRGQVSHIDLTLVSSVLATKCSWHTKNNTMGSDHMPILCHVDDHPYVETASLPKWKLDKADWKLYKEGCKNYIHTLLVYDDDIDTFNKNIINMVNTASGSSIPRRKSSKKTKHNPLPYWNDRIRKAVYDRNCARNKMNRTKTQENIKGYKRAKGTAQHIIKDSAVTYWQNYCNTIDSSTRLGTVWNMAKRMNGIQCNIANKHLIGTNGQVIESNADKAELLAQKFSAVSHTNNYSEKFRQQKCIVESNQSLLMNDARTTDNNQHLNIPFSEYEMRQAITQAKNNTSPGEDGIPYECLKELPGSGQRMLLRLYNLIWEKGHIPKVWKHAIVIPIPKGGKDPHEASSYRPIALTSTMCKVMERLVANRLTWYLEKHNILTNAQTGFRRNRSTTDQIIRLQDTINRSLRNHSSTLGVFLDFEKVFDMMWRSGLLIKLKSYGINGHMFDWIRDFLTDRTIQVRVGIELSRTHVIENGTPQGAMISPILFICMVNDIPDGLQEVDTSLFADDSAIYKSGRNVSHLQKIIQRNLDRIQTCGDT